MLYEEEDEDEDHDDDDEDNNNNNNDNERAQFEIGEEDSVQSKAVRTVPNSPLVGQKSNPTMKIDNTVSNNQKAGTLFKVNRAVLTPVPSGTFDTATVEHHEEKVFQNL